MIQNPILKGFCPDPSIIRVGDDYYIATSTFEWWPGVKLFHSKDLQHWEQIASPLRRQSQLNMLGDPTSGGVWAPCLSYDGTYFYLVFTDVKTKKGRYYNTHNYIVYTDDIYGEWSEPVYLNSIGFDPSLFHDTDGKKYLINMVNGFKGILVQEIEPKTFKLIGERKKVYSGSGIGCTEGPHIYHIGDWYYLLVAEGGTGYDHCVTMARAKSIWGPYETAPDNPILTSDRDDLDALQKSGHADFVDTQNGEWYMVHLCSRPLGGQKWCTLGRETAIQKMYWDEEGWLRLKSGGKFAGMQTESASGITEQYYNNEETGFSDDFDDEKLHVRYCSPRVSYDTFADCKSRRGYLRITGHESMNSLHYVSLVAVRQQMACCSAQTAMEFKPEYTEQLAGISYMYDAMNFYVLGKTVTENGESVLTLIKSDTGIVTDEITPVPIPMDKRVELKILVDKCGTVANFYYKLDGMEWTQVGGDFSTQILTDEHCRGFTGAHFGLYCHDMTGLNACADFDYMKVEK
ncbi:MAG: glycoside hydrolase family 43 protein [Lachnospiraceae bacterium]|nr:glycoside hydrolase family 43 protein [Lachnospiraceae bacterium]